MADGRSRRGALAIVLAMLAVLAAAFAVELLPRLTRTAPGIVYAPVPLGSRAPAAIPLEPGQRVCQQGIVFDDEADVVELLLDLSRPLVRAPLEVTLRAPGYAQRLRIVPDEHLLRLPFEPPRRAAAGTLCVRNAGEAATTLSASADPRVLQRTRAAVDDGAPLAAAFLTTFRTRDPGSLLSGVGTTAERAAAFSPLGPWAFWLLLGLLALVLPAALLAAYHVALRDRPKG